MKAFHLSQQWDAKLGFDLACYKVELGIFFLKGQLISKEDRLSFCINLEVVNLEVEIQRLFFGRSYGSTILFPD